MEEQCIKKLETRGEKSSVIVSSEAKGGKTQWLPTVGKEKSFSLYSHTLTLVACELNRHKTE